MIANSDNAPTYLDRFFGKGAFIEIYLFHYRENIERDVAILEYTLRQKVF